MINEKPSTQAPDVPEIPAILYPSGGINVCLQPKISTTEQQNDLFHSIFTYPDPPLALPKTPDLLPVFVRISIPSIHCPALTKNPRRISPRRVSAKIFNQITCHIFKKKKKKKKKIGTSQTGDLPNTNSSPPGFPPRCPKS